MDGSEIHYLTYDADEIMVAMMTAYMDAGGSVIRAGDEKEILLRGVQSIIAQAFAGIDNALRMDTLRYAVGEYLDLYGEKRNCYRIQAEKARAIITITTAATGEAVTIPAGAALTEDGVVIYQTEEDITLPGTEGTLTAGIIAETAGSRGNSLAAGAAMTFLLNWDGAAAVVCSAAATGGCDKEEDEEYRERIQIYGLSAVTTGPSEPYESLVRATSSEIIDAKAIHGDDLDVEIYMILKEGASAETIKAQVAAACSPKNKRPLNDHVIVDEAEDLLYTLNVQYSGPDNINLTTAVAEAVAAYQIWQDQKIGRVFNPDILKSYLYQAGCDQVIFAAGSEFDGGAAEYTEILPSQRCKGTITTAVIVP